MTPTITALPTIYKGHEFRSRLEARWAIFFDCMGWKWEYEPEAVETRHGGYLVDFRLPEFDCFAEIKPETFSSIESEKVIDACVTFKKYIHMLCGPPSLTSAISSARFHEERALLLCHKDYPWMALSKQFGGEAGLDGFRHTYGDEHDDDLRDFLAIETERFHEVIELRFVPSEERVARRMRRMEKFLSDVSPLPQRLWLDRSGYSLVETKLEYCFYPVQERPDEAMAACEAARTARFDNGRLRYISGGRPVRRAVGLV